jgi:hypothetical protein
MGLRILRCASGITIREKTWRRWRVEVRRYPSIPSRGGGTGSRDESSCRAIHKFKSKGKDARLTGKSRRPLQVQTTTATSKGIFKGAHPAKAGWPLQRKNLCRYFTVKGAAAKASTHGLEDDNGGLLPPHSGT